MDAKIKYAVELAEIKEYINGDPDRYYGYLGKAIPIYEGIIAAMDSDNHDETIAGIFEFIRLNNNKLEDVEIKNFDDIIKICLDVFCRDDMIRGFLEYSKLCRDIDVSNDETIIAAIEYGRDHSIANENGARLIDLVQSLYCENGDILSDNFMCQQMNDGKPFMFIASDQ
jgi:hypothetical protein